MSVARGPGAARVIPFGVTVLHLLLATWISIAHSVRHGHDRDFVDLGSQRGEAAQVVIGSVCPFCSAGLGAVSPGVPDAPPDSPVVLRLPQAEITETLVSFASKRTKLARAPPLA